MTKSTALSFQDFKSAIAGPARLLGLDLGTKTIGVAVSDPLRTVASPVETLPRGKFTKDAESLERLVAERGIGGIVLGLPVNMDGTEGPRCQATREFARLLGQRIALPITFWDERWSTAAVERMMISEADLSRKRRGEVVDKLAAAYILQGALDAMARR